MMKLAERLLLLRKYNKFTQKYVAENARISLRTYIHYERGEREPSATALIALSDVYSVSADYLLGLTDNPRRLF